MAATAAWWEDLCTAHPEVLNIGRGPWTRRERDIIGIIFLHIAFITPIKMTMYAMMNIRWTAAVGRSLLPKPTSSWMRAEAGPTSTPCRWPPRLSTRQAAPGSRTASRETALLKIPRRTEEPREVDGG